MNTTAANRAAKTKIHSVRRNRFSTTSRKARVLPSHLRHRYDRVVFSGIQPTGIPHLGNYLGALQGWKKEQDDAKEDTTLLYSIADFHALTVARNKQQALKRRRQCLAILLAIGLDPKKSIIFNQSQVPGHTELMWILGCTASWGKLSRMTQWKSQQTGKEQSTNEPSKNEPSKIGPLERRPSTNEPSTNEPSTHEPSTDEPATNEPATNEPSTDEPSTNAPSTDEPPTKEPPTNEPSTIKPSKKRLSTKEQSMKEKSMHEEPLNEWGNVGLFSYPLLQAADILLYRATHVPVGKDQVQHLEFARYCARKFNVEWGRIFLEPEVLLSPAKRIMSLTFPSRKMSKSDDNWKSMILITDIEENIRKKVDNALTDSISDITYDPLNRPGVANLLRILFYLEGEATSVESLAADMAGLTMKAFKARVTDVISSHFRDVRGRYEFIVSRKDSDEKLDEVAHLGAEKASVRARETMDRVREAVGI